MCVGVIECVCVWVSVRVGSVCVCAKLLPTCYDSISLIVKSTTKYLVSVTLKNLHNSTLLAIQHSTYTGCDPHPYHMDTPLIQLTDTNLDTLSTASLPQSCSPIATGREQSSPLGVKGYLGYLSFVSYQLCHTSQAVRVIHSSSAWGYVRKRGYVIHSSSAWGHVRGAMSYTLAVPGGT